MDKTHSLYRSKCVTSVLMPKDSILDLWLSILLYFTMETKQEIIKKF